MAAAVVAAGLSNVAQIAGINFAQGGLVPGTNYNGDKVRANLNSDERVLTSEHQRWLERVGAGGGNGDLTVNNNFTIEQGSNSLADLEAMFTNATAQGVSIAVKAFRLGVKNNGLAV
jgi:hypothetical protein